MDMKITLLNFKIMLESNPLKSRILVQRLAVADERMSSAIDNEREREVGFGISKAMGMCSSSLLANGNYLDSSLVQRLAVRRLAVRRFSLVRA